MPQYVERLPDRSLPWPITWAGVSLLCSREKCVNKTYLDWPGKRPTKGWGETEGVALGDKPWTDEECDQQLLKALTDFTSKVQGMCTVTPNDNQLAGLVVCAYNIGLPAMAKSSIMKRHNANDPNAAARAMLLYDKATDANGKLIVVDELVSRRHAEAALYLTPDPEVPSYPVPQTVAVEPPVQTSPTVQAGSVAVVTGGLTVASNFVGPLHDMANQLHDIAANLGITPFECMGAIAMVIGAFVVYRRVGQRRQGVA